MYNPDTPCQKYIIIGREYTIHNQGGQNVRKLITEVFKRVPHSMETGMVDYQKIYYRELVGGRGIDVDVADSGQLYLTIKRTAGDFIKLNYAPSPVDSNRILKFRTYNNQKFIKRDRKTSYHKELNVNIFKDGFTIDGDNE